MRTFIILLCMSQFAMAQNLTSALIPLPQSVKTEKGKPFTINQQTKIVATQPDLQPTADWLQQMIEEQTGITVSNTISNEKNKNVIILNISELSDNSEHYQITIQSKQIQITGVSPAAVFYGAVTLRQILLGNPHLAEKGQVQPMTIDDFPIFGYRSLMLDPARHFIPVDDVKKYIRQMALFKYNRLQLHLSDDQGWRIEIKKHPKLTEIGAFRKPNEGNKPPHNGFYTQAEIKELIAYARQFHIEIIPEIDVPGHTVALLATYPELRSVASDSVFDMNKTTNKMLSASNPKVYEILDDVIAEIAALFPNGSIHLGGDESAIESNWAVSEADLALMHQLGYTKPEQLMIYFFDKVLTSARKHNIKPILWCELDEIRPPATQYLFPYPKDVTLVTWRYGLTPTCINLTAQNGNSIILAPGEYAYLDYPQYKGDLPEKNNWGMPTTTLQRAYNFNPYYPNEISQTSHIIGVMGTLWGEAIENIDRANYMTWPRGMALAEAGWTDPSKRDFDSFMKRIEPHFVDLMKRGISVRVPFEVQTNKK